MSFEKLADFLADRFVAVQAAKTAAEQEKSTWQRWRPENPDRPGANWWTGIGGGAMATGAELGVGEHGLTDTVQRHFDRRNLRKNPLQQFQTPEFKSLISGNEQAEFLHDLFKRQSGSTSGKQAIGRLLSQNYGTLHLDDANEVKRLHGEIQSIVGSGNTKMVKRLADLTTSTNPAVTQRGSSILKHLDRFLDLDSTRSTPLLDPMGRSQLMNMRNSFGTIETADDLDKLQKALWKLESSFKGGKKGSPQSFVYSDKVRDLLKQLGNPNASTAKVQDADKVKELVTALGQFTKGRQVPTLLRRLRRGGSIAGVGTVAGAYALPSLIDFGKWVTGSGKQEQGN